jgi:predicted RND superfamily exporter protein
MPPPTDAPRLGGKHRILLALERFSRNHYRIVFLAAALALALGAWLGSALDLESNILALIPSGNRQVDTFRTALERFGSIDYLVLLVEAGPGQGPDEIEEFADLFAERIEQASVTIPVRRDAPAERTWARRNALETLSVDKDRESLRVPAVESVDYRFHIDEKFLELFYRNAVVFVPPERVPELRDKLSDAAIRERVRQLKLDLASPTASFLAGAAKDDPLGLMPLLLNRLEGTRGELAIDLSDGYYLARDHKTLIMLIKPTGPSQDLDFARALLAATRQAEQDARGEAPSAVRVRYGGNYAIAVDEARLILEDVRFNLLFSLLAVSALYWLCYRRFAALLYSSLPLLVGQALTFALCFVVLRQLNASSSAFTALLMGLGTDFVIVGYARYVEERRRGRTLAEATELMVGETGLGVFTGAITSAGTFYAMCVSQFRGLSDLGFLIGSGILLCAVAILFLLPAMIHWNEGVRPRKVDSVKKLHLQSIGLERLMPLAVRHRRKTIAVLSALTLGAAWLAWDLPFDDTINALRSNRSPAYDVQQEVGSKFGASLSYMMAIAEAPTREEALDLTARIAERVAPLRAEGLVGSVDSLLTYLPPEVEQRRVLDALAADQSGAFDPARVRATLSASLAANGFRPDAFAGFLGRLDRFLRPDKTLRLADLEGHGLDRILERYVSIQPGRVRIVTYLFLKDPRWKREPPPGLVQTIQGSDPGIVVTGTNVVNREFRLIFRREAPRAVLLGLVVVFVLLWIDFRNLRLTLIAMAQLVSGVILMFGAMRLLGIHLNYVNAFVATMILGVGIDYSIHIIHRLTMSGGRITSGLLDTGKAVVLAALTNIAGFGTLWLGNYPALRSFGQVALLGSATCLLTALMLVPAILGRESETIEVD